jgi:DNA-binding transcriptional LysR family regulator
VQLNDKALDIGLLRVPINAPSNIWTIVLHREPFVLLLPSSHRLVKKKSICLKDLDNEDFIMYTRKLAPGFHDRIMAVLNSAGLSPRIVQDASEMYTLVSLVASGLGVAIAPLSATLHHFDGVVHRKLSEKLPPSEIALAVNRENISPTAKRFIDLSIKTFLKNNLSMALNEKASLNLQS